MNNWEKTKDIFIGLGSIILLIFIMGWLSKL